MELLHTKLNFLVHGHLFAIQILGKKFSTSFLGKKACQTIQKKNKYTVFQGGKQTERLTMVVTVINKSSIILIQFQISALCLICA